MRGAAIKAGVPLEEVHTDAAFDTIAAAMRKQRPHGRLYTDGMTSVEQALASGELAAAMTWNETAVSLQSQDAPVKFAKVKEGALTWVCGPMIHQDAPDLDRAYDVIDSLISVETGKFMINDYGYGHSNSKSFEEFDAATLESLGLSDEPLEILNEGHFQQPQTQEWETKMNGMWEEIKAGF